MQSVLDAAGLNTRPLITKPELHPLNDPNVWAKFPAYTAPSGVDVKQCQRDIDAICGVTRDNQPIFKLVWSGDREYWHEVFMSWFGNGRPDKAPVKRPRVRYKTIRDDNGKLVRDVFPPRWMILCRLEPEQYADTYKTESYYFDSQIGCQKQIRPEVPPPVYWLWYSTIGHHNGYCCATADKDMLICYGEYAAPGAIYSTLGLQKEADKNAGMHSPFEKLGVEAITRIENQFNAYKYEIAKLKVESEIYIENPMALIGETAAYATGISVKKAKQIVTDYYKRRIDEESKLI